MQVIYEKLPQDISDRHVLLLDPILGTGMAIGFFISLIYFLWHAKGKNNLVFLQCNFTAYICADVCKVATFFQAIRQWKLSTYS